MKFSNQQPPNWQKLVQLFGANWEKAVVTYGDTVYSSQQITPDLEVHEAVHIEQQAAYGIEAWWERYYKDPAFRLDQELEAYRAHFKFFKKCCQDRNFLFRYQDRIARDLSGPVYGNCINYAEAFKQIAQAKKEAVTA